MSYIGRTGKLSQRAYNKVSFLATAGQTIKTGLSYVAGFVEVYLNGVLLTDTVDYTATNGNSVTFVLALNLDDEITIVSLKTFSVANMLPLSGGTIAGDLGVVGTVTVDGLVVDGDASINRLSTDGVLLDLKKDGTTVGSIGVLASRLSIGTGDTGLFFNDQTDQIQPFNTSTNSARDAAIDLGAIDRRFKDLYLSGGVVFGAAGGSGTSSSNTLDSYEEGTFTPFAYGLTTAGTATYTTAGGQYTKIGNLVTIKLLLAWSAHTGTGALFIGGLPFVSNAIRTAMTVVAQQLTYSGDMLVALSGDGYARVQLVNQSSGVGLGNVSVDESVSYMVITGTYET